jgi:phospholipid/cholesterol/gamma-HCH transport system permease protein
MSEAPSIRAEGRFVRHIAGARPMQPLAKLILLLSIMAAIVRQALRPVVWRPPVRAEFWRFMEIAGFRSLLAVCVLAAVLGMSLLAQGLYWSEQVGNLSDVVSIIGTIIVREIAPILVGLLMIGRGGLIMLSELAELHQSGHDRSLDAMGLDPFLLFVVPRTVALALSVFCLTIVLILVAFLTGYAFAILIGSATTGPLEFATRMYVLIGSAGYAILPVKTLLIGLAIGAVCALTAHDRIPTRAGFHEMLPAGFVRCVLAVIGVSTIASLLL